MRNHWVAATLAAGMTATGCVSKFSDELMDDPLQGTVLSGSSIQLGEPEHILYQQDIYVKDMTLPDDVRQTGALPEIFDVSVAADGNPIWYVIDRGDIVETGLHCYSEEVLVWPVEGAEIANSTATGMPEQPFVVDSWWRVDPGAC